MLVVRIELHKVKSGAVVEVKELSRMVIANVGGDDKRGDYRVWLAKRTSEPADGVVMGHRRLTAPIWSLVYKALRSVGFE